MPVRSALAAVVVTVLLAAGCGEEEVPPVALSCTEPAATITAALRAAPGQVTLADGATLSACIANARDAAALQNVGVTFAGAAEDLEARALDGDAVAALQLGYLVGAARKGSVKTIAYSAELVRRLERSAAVEDGGPQVQAALERGLAAGEQRGVRLRLFHAPDGTRVAYREAGTGPPLVLLHSLLLSHREFAPIVDELTYRHRVVLPDLPLHGDSEDRPRHAYTLDWYADVMAAFVRDTAGPRATVGGHEAGAEILLRAIALRKLAPGRLVLLPNRLHHTAKPTALRRRWRPLARLGGLPGASRAVARAAPHVVAPKLGPGLSATGAPAARDLVRHAFADVAGNPNLARSWSKLAGGWPRDAQRDLLDTYSAIDCPVLLLWADRDPLHPLALAEEALDLIPDAQLRVLQGAGFLVAYDDGVGMARELAAFCG